MSATLDLTRSLIELESLTPDDAGCQKLLADRLTPLGFEVAWFPFGDVTNVLYTHGRGEPTFWFLGHTDVVPPGPLEDWTSPPFEPKIRNGSLYGRGAADMKGGVAAFVVAAEEFVREHPDHEGQVGILLTSDEEGIAVDGVRRVAEALKERDGVPKYCLVGEPSCHSFLGDTIRIGRRGSSQAKLKVFGIQGHSAFPEKLDNPVHRLSPFLKSLINHQWDRGDENFPPTHCQITNINAGTGAENVTPGMVEVWFNFRNSPASPSARIKSTLEEMLRKHDIRDYDLNWRVSGESFRSDAGKLREATVEAIRSEIGVEPDLNTGGGTSDGRFIAPLGTEVLEFGLINTSIHKVDENTSVDDLDVLSQVYRRIVTNLLGKPDV